MGPAEVKADLGLDESYEAWVRNLGDVEVTGEQLESPEPGWALEVLGRLGLSQADGAEIVAGLPIVWKSDVWRWLLGHCRARLEQAIGDIESPRGMLPRLPAHLGAAGRCFPIYVYLVTLPVTLEWQAERGIPEEVSWTTLSDIARHVAIHRRVHGTVGVDAPDWMTLHLRGLIYECGRLQYNLMRLGGTPFSPGIWYETAETLRRGVGFRSCDEALGVHIPEGRPLTPGSCQESHEAARTFFERYFPAECRRLAVCESWLLDDQLAQYLPAHSNIVEFQRSYVTVPGWVVSDEEICEFVFRKRRINLDEAPQGTTLERAVVKHLQGGRHWRVRCGWFHL